MSHVNIGGLQIVFWPLPEQWAIAAYSWPRGQTLRACEEKGLDIGYRALALGPIEFRLRTRKAMRLIRSTRKENERGTNV